MQSFGILVDIFKLVF